MILPSGTPQSNAEHAAPGLTTSSHKKINVPSRITVKPYTAKMNIYQAISVRILPIGNVLCVLIIISFPHYGISTNVCPEIWGDPAKSMDCVILTYTEEE